MKSIAHAVVLAAALILMLSGNALAASTGADTPDKSAQAHSEIPFKQDQQPTEQLAARSVGALVVVGIVGYLVLFLMKRHGFAGVALIHPRKGHQRRIQILEATRLSQKVTLHVVAYRGTELLLAESPEGIQLIHMGGSGSPAASPSGESEASNHAG